MQFPSSAKRFRPPSIGIPPYWGPLLVYSVKNIISDSDYRNQDIMSDVSTRFLCRHRLKKIEAAIVAKSYHHKTINSRHNNSAKIAHPLRRRETNPIRTTKHRIQNEKNRKARNSVYRTKNMIISRTEHYVRCTILHQTHNITSDSEYHIRFII